VSKGIGVQTVILFKVCFFGSWPFLCAVAHKLCCRNRAVRPGTPLWRPCSAHMGLGLDRVLYHFGGACNERAFFQVPCLWGPVLLVVHVGRTVWALCKLACWVGQSVGAGKFLECCCIASCNQSFKVNCSCAGCLRQRQHIHICAIVCCWTISVHWLFCCDRLLPEQCNGETMCLLVRVRN